jgi:hypothetical protein
VTLLDRELAAAHEALKAMHHHAEQARGDLLRGQEALARRADEQAGEVERLRHRLDAVLSSRIWRWTSSLRASIDALLR